MMMTSALFWINTLSWIVYSFDSSLKQQSVRGDVAPFGNIILIPIQPIFALSA
jgi:hypothetical protein